MKEIMNQILLIQSQVGENGNFQDKLKIQLHQAILNNYEILYYLSFFYVDYLIETKFFNKI